MRYLCCGLIRKKDKDNYQFEFWGFMYIYLILNFIKINKCLSFTFLMKSRLLYMIYGGCLYIISIVIIYVCIYIYIKVFFCKLKMFIYIYSYKNIIIIS